jgi:hypothetical protein
MGGTSSTGDERKMQRGMNMKRWKKSRVKAFLWGYTIPTISSMK